MDLFALLRAGVRSGDTPDIGGLTDDRWRELYTAASSQGVSALVWDGIRRLPPESQPSRELRLRWAYNVERIERRYGQQRRRAAELAAAYAEAGIRTVVLKGLAVSRLYPVPEHRPCGDLDCFLCGDSGGRTGRGRGETRFLQTLPYRIPRADGRKPPVLYGGSRKPSGEAVRAASSTIACGGTVVLHTGNGAARPSARFQCPFSGQTRLVAFPD